MGKRALRVWSDCGQFTCGDCHMQNHAFGGCMVFESSGSEDWQAHINEGRRLKACRDAESKALASPQRDSSGGVELKKEVGDG